jgi:magnesium transporter
VELIAYGPERLVEEKISNVEIIPSRMRDQPVVWINVEGLGDAQTIERLGEMFDLHRLALEDVVNLHQRPKVEEYGDVLFIVLRMAHVKERCATEQISIFVGSNFVITFQEGQPGDSFGRVRQRLREKSGRLRTSGSDYLAYAMIDAVIDAYYPVLEVYAERIDSLEDIVLEGPKRQVFDRLHEVKSDLLLLRRAIWPQREAIAVLSRETSLRFNEATRPYLRDCYDHIVQIVELVETYRELTADLRDLYMSTISNRINETMRVLTIMSSLFIPLTFIAGIYGMNFDTRVSPWNMPEVEAYYGYPLTLLGMALTAAGMTVFFYRQGWIFQRNS